MLTRKALLSSACRKAVAAMAVLLLIAIGGSQTAGAGPSASGPDAVLANPANVGSSDATDISAARRRRHYRGGGNAAGLAFFGMALGTIGAIAAQQQRNDYYNNYNGGYGPGYYGGGPYYEGGTPYYGRRYYRRY
ncbi:MAG TPA: hypothetical protein VMT72_09710 [Pseudolabrys sp.]|nr:hypothetical protein [Pseudolabrys sp.]